MPFLSGRKHENLCRNSGCERKFFICSGLGERLMKKKQYTGVLRRKLGNRLFSHSMGVARMAYSLALAHGVDEEASFLAGLLHDYGKALSPQELMEKAKEMHLSLDDFTRRSPHLLHAPVGAALVRHDFGIKDRQVLRAIKFHTVGAPRLNNIEKIVYLADAIEMGRSYPGVRKLRRLAFSDLDKTIRIVVDNTIKRVIQKGDLLHPLSVAFRNELLFKEL